MTFCHVGFEPTDPKTGRCPEHPQALVAPVRCEYGDEYDADLSRFEADPARFTDVSEHILQALCEDETLSMRRLADREVEPPQSQPLALMQGANTRNKLPGWWQNTPSGLRAASEPTP